MSIILETERLLLRKFTLDDVEAVFEFGSSEKVSRFTGEPPLQNLKQAEKIITEVLFADYKKYGYGRLATVWKHTNNVIGFAGLKFLPEYNINDIGYRFLPEFWGKGIATEACNAITNYGLKKMNLREIIGITMPENVASSKVLEKCGYSFYKSEIYSEEDPILCNWYKIKNKNEVIQ